MEQKTDFPIQFYLNGATTIFIMIMVYHLNTSENLYNYHPVLLQPARASNLLLPFSVDCSGFCYVQNPFSDLIKMLSKKFNKIIAKNIIYIYNCMT